MDGRRVVVVGYDQAELLDIACVTTTLTMVNTVTPGATPYEVLVAGPGGRPVRCVGGMVLQAHAALEQLDGPLDTLVVAGGFGHAAAAANSLVVGNVHRLARTSRRVASVCTGASVLAAAGLLDGRRATTHWHFADRLAAGHPQVEVDPDPIYIRDGNVSTSAGVTSALDLTLAFVAEDHGPKVARTVSRTLVTYLQRPGNQAQMSVWTAGPPTEHDLVRRVVDHVREHLDGDLGTPALAALAGVSTRHLTRLFLAHVGRPPGRFVRDARTEAAARLLTTTTLPVPVLARRCGYGSAEALRQAFQGRYGLAPTRFRALHG